MSKPKAILDCRDPDTFATGHLSGACNIPAGQLFHATQLLPQRHVPLVLCVDEFSQQTALNFLQQRRYAIEKLMVMTDKSMQTFQLTPDWQTGHTSAQLWQPSSVVKYFTDTLVQQYEIPSGTGLDIACGAGRDMVYLAQKGWNMTGLDHHQDALQRSQLLAQYSKVTVQTQQLDLEATKNPLLALPAASQDLLCVVRYLHRPLFPSLLRLLKPGGILIYQTFMLGCEKIGSPRNPNYLLKPGELAHSFSELTILYDEVEHLEDGRPLNSFIARRPT